MELSKRFYKRTEVLELLKVCEIDYESRLNQQKARIEALIAEIDEKEAKLKYYEDKEWLIVKTLNNAEQKAEEIIANAQAIYDVACIKLQNFSALLSKVAKEKSKPQNKKTVKEIDVAIANIVKSDEEAEKKVERAERVLTTKSSKKTSKRKVKEDFNPKEKIDAYIAATKVDGFDIEKVINPGEIDLEELCKEMGLMQKR